MRGAWTLLLVLLMLVPDGWASAQLQRWVDEQGTEQDVIQVGEAKAGPFLVIAHDASFNDADGILARDFLDNFKVTIDAGQGVVTLEPR